MLTIGKIIDNDMRKSWVCRNITTKKNFGCVGNFKENIDINLSVEFSKIISVMFRFQNETLFLKKIKNLNSESKNIIYKHNFIADNILLTI